ncbi:hypothetical protein SALBM311S_02421 [Streptomyces alboniger]
MSITLSTSSLSPADRAEFWRDAVSHTFVPLDVELYEAEPSAATITSHQLGPLQVSTVSAGPQKAVRDRRMIARGGESHLTLAIQHHGTARLEQDGREAFLEPGQFALSDSARPFLKELPAKFGFTAFHLPRTALNVTDGDLTGPHRHRVLPHRRLRRRRGGLSGERWPTTLPRSHPRPDTNWGSPPGDLLATLIRECRDRHAPQAPEATRAMLGPRQRTTR